MKTSGVLIIYGSLIFAEAVRHILKAADIPVAAEVTSLEAGVSILASHQVQAIVVDNDDDQLLPGQILSLVHHSQRNYPIIFLTMVRNQMTIHRCQQKDNVTPTDLIEAIRSTTLPSGESHHLAPNTQ